MQKIEISKFLQILVEGENSYAYCPAGDAARIIPPVIRLYKNTGEHIDYLLFVEEYRQPLGKNIINFPGGRLNKGEDGLKAIVRELIEETGINVEVNSIKLLTASKPKDPANSAEAECLFICPQVIEINEKEGGLKSFTDKLYKNQNLDETEYCKIKLVEISNLQEFSNHNDLCLPTRLALLQLMAVKNKATNFCKSKSFYSYNKDDLNPQIVYQTKNLTAKKVDVGFDYCYYSPKKENRISVMMEFSVEDKKYYAFTKNNYYSTKGEICTMPHFDFSGNVNTNSEDYTLMLLNKYNLNSATVNVVPITSFDAVSPGFTDLRQSVCLAKINMTKSMFEDFKKNRDMIFVEQSNLNNKVLNTDYITSLTIDLCNTIEFNRKQEKHTKTNNDEMQMN